MSVVVWFTGLPSAGKSTLAKKAQAALAEDGNPCCLLDGDELREAFVPRPGYSPDQRKQFYNTLANLAGLIARQGFPVLVAATASRRAYREYARDVAPAFLEVFVSTPVDECRRRDPKELYARAESGEVSDVPGVDAPYEPPVNPDIEDRGHLAPESVDQIVLQVRFALARATSTRPEGATGVEHQTQTGR